MYTVTSQFLAALRQSHSVLTRIDMWRGGTLVATDIPYTDGAVAINSGTGVRRQLTLTIADRSLWSELSVIGTELRPYRGIRYGNGTTELVPLGVFSIDSHSMNVGANGSITIGAAPDRWAKVQRTRFETPAASIKGATKKSEIARLMGGAVPVAVVNTATATDTVGAVVWDRDRDKAVIDLADAISAEAYFDNIGNITIRNVPLLSAAPVWTVDASSAGVLLGGERSRDRTRTYNVVVVFSSATDGAVPFAPQIVADTDPTSPTYVLGPMGRVPYFYASPLFTSAAQALAAGKTMLNKVKGVAAQLNLSAVCNPALERGDVITVITADGTAERHLIEAFTVPLTVAGTQEISTRSSRPEGDVPAEE